MIHGREMLEHLGTSLGAAGGRGSPGAVVQRLPGTANGDYFGKGD